MVLIPDTRSPSRVITCVSLSGFGFLIVGLLLFLLLHVLCSSDAVSFVCPERIITHFVPFLSERVRATFTARSWEPRLSSRSKVGTVPPLHASDVDTQLRRFQVFFSRLSCVFVSFFSLQHCFQLLCEFIPYYNTDSGFAAVNYYY